MARYASFACAQSGSIVGTPRCSLYCKITWDTIAERVMNLPNSLTILRIFFVPLLVVVLLSGTPNLVVWGVPINFAVWGVLILLVAAATDLADGYYARRRGEVTTFGILLDPNAGKQLIPPAFGS